MAAVFTARWARAYSPRHHRKRSPMAEPLDKPQFDALIQRAGIVLTEAEAEGIRQASRYLVAAAMRMRTPREVAVEMATTFAPQAPR